MMLQGCRKADRAEVVERDRFATPNSLKSHRQRNLLSPVSILVPERQSCACLRGQYTLRKIITRHSNHVPRLNLHSPAAPPVPHFPRFRALALFGRRPPQRVESLVMPASKNLHNAQYPDFADAHCSMCDSIMTLTGPVPKDHLPWTARVINLHE